MTTKLDSYYIHHIYELIIYKVRSKIPTSSYNVGRVDIYKIYKNDEYELDLETFEDQPKRLTNLRLILYENNKIVVDITIIKYRDYYKFYPNKYYDVPTNYYNKIKTYLDLFVLEHI